MNSKKANPAPLLLLLPLLENKLNKNLPERNFVSSSSISFSISDEARKNTIKNLYKIQFLFKYNNNNHKLGAAANADCDAGS